MEILYTVVGLPPKVSKMSPTLAATLRNRAILLGRVLPRVHSEVAKPTFVRNKTWDVTPKEAVVIRVPTMEFDQFFKRVRRLSIKLSKRDFQRTF